MESIWKRTKTNIILMAIITFILGLILVIYPGAAALTICLILGWSLVAFGVVTIIMHFAAKNKTINRGSLAAGILELILGLWMVIFPVFWVRFLFIILGLLLLFHGFGDIGDAIEMKRCGGKGWVMAMIFAIVTLVLGVLVLIAPFAGAVTTVMICGFSLIFDAVTDVVIALRISSAVKNATKQS